MLNPNIWLIQKDHRKLQMALAQIDKNSSNNFLYTNCISHFKFNEVNMSSKNFNTFLYSEESNTCIVFMKDSIQEIEYAKKYLNSNNVQYHEISLKNEPEDIINRHPHSLHDYEKNSKEIWVINNGKDLASILKDSLKKQRKKIAYYPFIDSNIKLTYSNNGDYEYEINEFNFEGVIVTVDKIILISKSKEESKIINFLVKNTMADLGVKYVTVHFNRPRFINEEEKRNQKYNNECIDIKRLSIS